ncbi:hypothetical protein JW865_03950 [Candidatus Bathyarchaeota archaeon]|nr:hypothetical protein [Candidatus Bathyarchaeota archaeon]
MSVSLSTEDIFFEGKKYSVGVLELSNAVIILFWEGDDPKLGSTSITLPKLASTQVIGERDQVFGQMVGTQIANKFNKITLVSTHLQLSKSEGRDKVLIELLNNLLKKVMQ